MNVVLRKNIKNVEKERIINDRFVKKIVTKQTLNQNKKETGIIHWTQNEEENISKLKHCRVYSEQERWRKPTSYVHDELE